MARFSLFPSQDGEQRLRFRRYLIAAATSVMFLVLLTLCFVEGVLSAPPFAVASVFTLLAIVVFGGETGALMTIAREKTNWAAHLYVYLALLSLGIALLYLALIGPDSFKKQEGPDQRD